MDTPSHALAAKITERLVREGLIRAEAAKQLQPKLAEGQLRPEDWRLTLEVAGVEEPNP
jgi:hypothetical protein